MGDIILDIKVFTIEKDNLFWLKEILGDSDGDILFGCVMIFSVSEYLYIIRCLVFKYKLIILNVLKLSDET